MLIFHQLQNMQKTSYLESSILLSQLQSRLDKNAYLSQGEGPSYADARVFLAIQRLKQIPDRRSHPNLYHWYIIMKQFARRTLEIWLAGDDNSIEEDQLITLFTQEANQSFLRKSRQNKRNQANDLHFLRFLEEIAGNEQEVNSSPKDIRKRRISQNYVEFSQSANYSHKEISNATQKGISTSPELTTKAECAYISYTMEMQMNAQNHTPLQSLKERLAQQSMDLLSFELKDKSNLRVIFKVDGEEYEGMKDRISKWTEVSNLRFRKNKKTEGLGVRSERMICSPLKKIVSL